MEATHWHKAWSENRIGFHESRANKRLQEHWSSLELAQGSTVFVPLCGKALDMIWLHEQGHAVFGVELSEKAVQCFFDENELNFKRSPEGRFVWFRGAGSASGIDIAVGDFFHLSAADCEHVSGFYDRASLVAWNDELRPDYVRHLAELMQAETRGLLLSIDYDQSVMQGPPFAVSDQTARQLLNSHFDIRTLAHYSGAKRVGNLAKRGLKTLDERVYRLERRTNK
ncbi:MAG: thiopurine S-methyltransferase [Granulosicoccus sp.]